MSTRNKIIFVVGLMVVAFAFGRYTVPEKVKEINQTEKSDQSQVDKDKDVNTHKETKTDEIIKPDGTKETITDTTEDTASRTTQQTENSASSVSSSDKEVTRSSGRLNLSFLGGVQIAGFDAGSPLLYGGHVSKDIIGPISIGVWGLNNRTVGASIGLTF